GIGLLSLATAQQPVTQQATPQQDTTAAPIAVVGGWEGMIDPGAQAKKRIVVHITAAQDGTVSGTLDFPDDNASGTPNTAITYKAPALHFESKSNLAVYDGTMNGQNNEITGTWKQGATPVTLNLKKVND